MTNIKRGRLLIEEPPIFVQRKPGSFRFQILLQIPTN